MARAIISYIIQTTDQLAIPIRTLFGSSSEALNVEEDLKKLQRTLLRIEAVLHDAEEREISNSSVKLWLSELQDVAYDAEDLLDEFEYELLRAKVEGGAQRYEAGNSSTSPLSNPSFQEVIEHKIKKINERFDDIAYQRYALHLKEGDGERRYETHVRPPTSSIVDESEVYGRDGDRNEVIELLLSDEYRRRNVSVVPIVGMGGVGKTTLVQLVYNDMRICEHFELRGWVCVSEDFEVVKLTKAIIESFTKKACDLNELSVLQEILMHELRGKRFLLVLDDVWNEKQSLWDRLKAPLNFGAKGSAVIVTTRNEPVAKIMQTGVPLYHLECLLYASCWSLFQLYAFDGLDPSEHPNLVEIGKKIVERCKGLPLAAKALGGLLSSELDIRRWNDILQCNLWELDNRKDEILPALKVSYQHLPVHLKRCFAYCSVFPKDYLFRKDKLVRLWMGQGFIQSKERKAVEDIGIEYFDDLLRRSFFQRSLLREAFVMHDLFHDLAQSISGKYCSRIDADKLCTVSLEARHSSLITKHCNIEVQFQSFHEPRPLRTFLVIDTNTYLIVTKFLEHVINLNDMFLNFIYLRALDLSHSDIAEVPNSIGNMRHLRYINLSGTSIKKLPESICRLYNLQTMELNSCRGLKELPKGMKNLTNLRHLDLDKEVGMPIGIGELSNLQTLSHFNVGRVGGHYCGIEELKKLVNLRGELCISGLENVQGGGEEAKAADLKNKVHLDKLTLTWRDNTARRSSDNEVLDSLQPHTGLRQLDIEWYGGDRFPDWVGDPSFSKLVSIRLYHCTGCKHLPPLGQLPSLHHLTIEAMNDVERVGPEFCHNSSSTAVTNRWFPLLETLDLQFMYKLIDWFGVEEGDFPRLRRLIIGECPEFRRLPCFLYSLTELYVEDGRELTDLPILPSLRYLKLACCYQLYDLTLTPWLKTLEIDDYPNAVTFPLYMLSVLESLSISNCRHLTSIEFSSPCSSPVVGASSNLTSLKRLEIANCPQLCFSPDEQLPPTLQYFRTEECPLLSEWCERHADPKLNYIPQVFFDPPPSDFGGPSKRRRP